MTQGIYTGPPPLTWSTWLTSWTFDPWAAAIILLGAAGYMALLRRDAASGTRWPRSRTLLFFGGFLGVVLLATMSAVGVYAHTLFSMATVQVVLLLLVAPLLLALSAPLTLATENLPVRWAERLSRGIDSAPLRVVTYPPATTVLMVALPLLLYFTGWFQASMQNYFVFGLTHLVLLAAGFLFLWASIGVDPLPRQFPFAATALLVFVETLLDVIPALVLWFSTNVVASSYYEAVGRPWGRSLIADQKLGAAILWGVAEVVGLPFLLIIVWQWMRSDEREARRIDEHLDAERASDEVHDLRDGEPRVVGTQTAAPWWVADPEALKQRGRKFDWE